MNKHEHEVIRAQLLNEKQTLKTIQAVYQKALEDVENKLIIQNGKINTLLKDVDNLTDKEKSILQSQIYQRKMQRSLKSQLEIMLRDLAVNQYGTINEYLKNSYQNGYIGALYNINMQGMPLILPIDPYLVHRAIEIDSKIKHGLYRNLVSNVNIFKRRIANDISRGIASSSSYHDMAAWIRQGTKVSVGKSMRIVRTEGNRIYNAATLDCGEGAKKRGCDLVKVWDSTLDMKTRPTHRQCDGQVRELEEDFKNSNGTAKAPGQFGIASEDINCRCAVLIKPRWDVDGSFTKRDNETKELKEFEDVKSYESFKKRYWEAEKNAAENETTGVDKSTYVKNAQVQRVEKPQEKFAFAKVGASKGAVGGGNTSSIGYTSQTIDNSLAESVDKSVNSGIIKEIEEIGIKGIPNIPPKPIDINNLTINEKHISDRGHGVTFEEAKSFITDAKVSFTEWKGKSEKYFSKKGAAYVDVDNNNIKTAYKASEYDDKVNKLMEVLDDNEP